MTLASSVPYGAAVRGIAPAVLAILLAGCGREPGTDASAATDLPPAAAEIRGELIVPLSTNSPPATGNTDTAAAPSPEAFAALPVPIPIPVPTGLATDPAVLLPLSFDTLSGFPYTVGLSDPEPGTQRQRMVTDDEIPDAIRALDGRRILIAGYVAPVRTQGRGLTQFLLARDPLSCCFGPSPQMNHWIHVTLPRTEQRFRMFQAVTVVGTLRVGELRSNGSLQSIYRLDGERAELMPHLSVPLTPPPPTP